MTDTKRTFSKKMSDSELAMAFKSDNNSHIVDIQQLVISEQIVANSAFNPFGMWKGYLLGSQRTKTGLAFIGLVVQYKIYSPAYYIIYHDGTRLRGYVPKRGNVLTPTGRPTKQKGLFNADLLLADITDNIIYNGPPDEIKPAPERVESNRITLPAEDTSGIGISIRVDGVPGMRAFGHFNIVDPHSAQQRDAMGQQDHDAFRRRHELDGDEEDDDDDDDPEGLWSDGPYLFAISSKPVADVEGTVFFIEPKAHWDAEHCQCDQHLPDPIIQAVIKSVHGGELMEGTFESSMKPDVLRKHLLAAGLIEDSEYVQFINEHGDMGDEEDDEDPGDDVDDEPDEEEDSDPDHDYSKLSTEDLMRLQMETDFGAKKPSDDSNPNPVGRSLASYTPDDKIKKFDVMYAEAKQHHDAVFGRGKKIRHPMDSTHWFEAIIGLVIGPGGWEEYCDKHRGEDDDE